MKLRIRSLETKETIRIETPTPCSLHRLKTLISGLVAAPPDSLRLSLNRKDELSSDNNDDTVHSLGLTSGDLIFYTINPHALSAPPPPPSADESLEIATKPPVESEPSAVKVMDQDSKASDAAVIMADESIIGDGVESDEGGYVPTQSSSFSVPGFLKRVMEEEAGMGTSDIALLVIAVHAVFLESGFVVHGTSGSRLPEGWASRSPVVSISYTLPGLEDSCGDAAIKVMVSLLGKFVNVYGSLGGSPDVYRVCIDVSRFVPSVASTTSEVTEKDERVVFELWKMVKDGLSLPLLIDICEKCGFSLPPCFTCLPMDLKIKVLEFLPGVDLARIGCVSSELRYLSSNDDLWGKKFIEEFELLDGRGLFGKRWRDKFIICWEKKKRNNIDNFRRVDCGYVYGVPLPPYWRRPVPFAPPRINFIGGDYDRFPAIGAIGPGGSGRDVPRFLGRRNFSPNCNLGGFSG